MGFVPRGAWLGVSLILLASCTDYTATDYAATNYAATDPAVPAFGEEVDRVNEHLAGALAQLREARPRGLTNDQVEARAETIAWLEQYRAKGLFPHNHVQLGQRVPIFVDGHGTPCAVGYLMLRSGEDALVEVIVRESILARVPDLAGDARLGRWLEERGLTLAEAARIQPTYGGGMGAGTVSEESDYAGTTVALSIVTAAAVALTELTEPNPSGTEWVAGLDLAVLAGHGIILGLATREQSDAAGWVKGVNIGGAALGAVALVRRVLKRRAVASEGETAFTPFLGRSGGQTHVGFTYRR